MCAADAGHPHGTLRGYGASKLVPRSSMTPVITPAHLERVRSPQFEALPCGRSSSRSCWPAPPSAHCGQQIGRRPVGEVSQDGNSTLADEVGATLRPCGSHAHGCDMHLFGRGRGASDEKMKRREGVVGVGGGCPSDKGARIQIRNSEGCGLWSTVEGQLKNL